MSTTPLLTRADDETIVAWIRSLNTVALKLTDNRPRVFEVGPEGSVLIGDANLFFSIEQFKQITGVKPGIWRTEYMNEEDNDGDDIIHWQFHWVSPGPLDIDNLPTEDTCPRPQLEPLTDWEKIHGFGVDSGKVCVLDTDMMRDYIGRTGDERLVISVCQDPFSERMGYQGVLPGGFFTCVHDGGQYVYARKHEGMIVQLKMREARADADSSQ